MKKLLLLIALMASFGVSAQFSKPMNWSAIITDNSGEPLISTNVNLKFSITDGETGVLRYSEDQTQMTNANGFINATIGTGTSTFGVYNAPLWMSEKIKLKVEADTGDGFVILSDDEVTAVPLANKAISASFLQYEQNYLIISQEPGGLNEMGFILNNIHVGTLQNNGTLQLGSLAGTGDRDVVVNASGELHRKPALIKNYSVPAAAFSIPGFTYDQSNGFHNISGASIALQHVVPVHLPDGVKITQIKVHFYDNTAESLGVYLVKFTDNSTTSTTLSNINSSTTQPSAVWQTNTSTNAINHTVDNAINGYYLVLDSPSWPSGTNKLGIKRIVISYEE